MNLNEFISSILKNLDDKSLIQDIKFLVKESLKISNTDLAKAQLTSQQLSELTVKVEDLKKGKPLSYILKSQPFLDYNFYVDEGVLIPRPETEFLMDVVLRSTDDSYKNVVDAGAGSGCLGISYLLKRQSSFCVFIENSKPALEVLKYNLNKFKIDSLRYRIFESFDELDNETNHDSCGFRTMDLILSNPPYISRDDLRLETSVRLFEPHNALFADDQGLFYLKSWPLRVKKYAKAGHTLGFFEFGEGQHIALQDFAKLNLLNYEIFEDQYKIKRFLKIKY